jgi:hypothetical protein
MIEGATAMMQENKTNAREAILRWSDPPQRAIVFIFDEDSFVVHDICFWVDYSCLYDGIPSFDM